jgi:hypothetical protein
VGVLTAARVEPRWQAFNVVVGNMDGHAKNLALLREPTVRLAPPYDLVCTQAWPHPSQRLALSVGGTFDAGNVGPRAWATFAEQAQMSARAVIAAAADMTERVAAALPAAQSRAVEDGANAGVVAHVGGLIGGFVARSRHLHAVERPEPRARRAAPKKSRS